MHKWSRWTRLNQDCFDSSHTYVMHALRICLKGFFTVIHFYKRDISVQSYWIDWLGTGLIGLSIVALGHWQPRLFSWQSVCVLCRLLPLYSSKPTSPWPSTACWTYPKALLPDHPTSLLFQPTLLLQIVWSICIYHMVSTYSYRCLVYLYMYKKTVILYTVYIIGIKEGRGSNPGGGLARLTC